MSPRRALALPLLALATLAVAPSDAHAWKHTERVWLPEDMPLRYWVADNGEDGGICVDDPLTTPLNEQFELDVDLDGVSDTERLACCEETVPGGYCIDAAAQGFAAWEVASCAEFDTAYQGVIQNFSSAADNRNAFTFNDPGNQIEEVGTLAVTFSYTQGSAFIYDGVTYQHMYDADIVFNDDVTFATHESAVAGDCNGGTDMLAVYTHEIGHLLGMDHSCEREDICTDPLLAEATMNWSIPECTPDQADISQDDIEGFTALYGPSARFECSHEVSSDLAIGVVPFDLNCVLVSDYLDEITSAQWNFGDGGTAETLTPSHRYTEPGTYTIQLQVQGHREACGDEGWENNYRKVGYVRACGVPDVAFEVVPDEGLTYQMLNNSDVSVYGCIQDIEWQVFRGTDTEGEPVLAPVKAWEPLIAFPEPGEYTVVAHIGGYAGTGAAKITLDVSREAAGCGCSGVGSGAGGALWLLAAAATLGRRRRR